VKTAALVAALSTSCSLGGNPPQYDYYVSTPPEAPPRVADQPQNSPLVLVIAPVELPSYLNRDQVVTRTGEYSIVYSKRDRWAEPLNEAFEGILRQCLARRLSPQGISVQARRIGLVPEYTLQVELLRFERHDSHHVELWARWTLRSKAGSTRGNEFRIHEATASEDVRGAAASLSHAIDRLSGEVAAATRGVELAAPQAE